MIIADIWKILFRIVSSELLFPHRLIFVLLFKCQMLLLSRWRREWSLL